MEVRLDDGGAPGEVVALYACDALGRRVEKIVGGTDLHDDYYSESYQVVEVREDLHTTPVEQYVWDLRYVDAPVVRFYDPDADGPGGGQTHYYITDAKHNVTALVDTATGQVVERYTYDPYGNATIYDAAGGSTRTASQYGNEVLYSGYRHDPETGLYHVRARYYHPTLGQWITSDPVGVASFARFRFRHLVRVRPGLLASA